MSCNRRERDGKEGEAADDSPVCDGGYKKCSARFLRQRQAVESHLSAETREKQSARNHLIHEEEQQANTAERGRMSISEPWIFTFYSVAAVG